MAPQNDRVTPFSTIDIRSPTPNTVQDFKILSPKSTSASQVFSPKQSINIKDHLLRGSVGSTIPYADRVNRVSKMTRVLQTQIENMKYS